MFTADFQGANPDNSMVALAPDRMDLRRALGRFATGVTIITVRTDDGTCHGLTANSFSSVSLDPPLILFSLSNGSSTLPHILSVGRFAVNVLSDEHEELARRFARSDPDKFDQDIFGALVTGSPVVNNALAIFDCELHAQFDGGDHVIVVGRVLALQEQEGRPLVFYRGRYSLS